MTALEAKRRNKHYVRERKRWRKSHPLASKEEMVRRELTIEQLKRGAGDG